jgi:uncharacterized protein (DUF1778 family)
MDENETRYVLTPEQFAQVEKMLDEPPKDLPRLRELLKRPTVFEVD